MESRWKGGTSFARSLRKCPLPSDPVVPKHLVLVRQTDPPFVPFANIFKADFPSKTGFEPLAKRFGGIGKKSKPHPEDLSDSFFRPPSDQGGESIKRRAFPFCPIHLSPKTKKGPRSTSEHGFHRQSGSHRGA